LSLHSSLFCCSSNSISCLLRINLTLHH
jgi:hypothetical protein